MKKLLFLIVLSIFSFAMHVQAKQFVVPASNAGAFADLLQGNRLLRESGVELESTANIVELRLKLIKKINGKRVSFQTLKGDTFFFNEHKIWLERKGAIIASYSIKEKKGQKLSVKKIDPSVKKTRSIKEPKKSLLAESKDSIDSSSLEGSTKKQMETPILVYKKPMKKGSIIDSLNALPRAIQEKYVLSDYEIGRIIQELNNDFAYSGEANALPQSSENDNEFFLKKLKIIEQKTGPPQSDP